MAKGRYRNFARRTFRTRTYGKGRRVGAAINMQFVAGLGASFIPVNLPPIVNVAVTGLAVAPIRLPYGIKMAAQGYVLGKLIQTFIGNPLAGVTGGSTGASSPWV